MPIIKNLLNTENISGIVALTAVISTVITTLINCISNLISLHMTHKHEQRFKYGETYYNNCVDVFTGLLDSAGKLLANSQTDAEILNTLSYIYRAYAYADVRLSMKLDIFSSRLETWNNNIDNEDALNECQEFVPKVAWEINRLLIQLANIHRQRPNILCRLLQRIRQKIQKDDL